jgi:hypothetical protein
VSREGLRGLVRTDATGWRLGGGEHDREGSEQASCQCLAGSEGKHNHDTVQQLTSTVQYFRVVELQVVESRFHSLQTNYPTFFHLVVFTHSSPSVHLPFLHLHHVIVSYILEPACSYN